MRGGEYSPWQRWNNVSYCIPSTTLLPNKVTSNHSYFWGLIVANESRYPWYAACMPIAHQLWFPLIPPIQSSLFHAPLEPSCYKIKLFADKIYELFNSANMGGLIPLLPLLRHISRNNYSTVSNTGRSPPWLPLVSRTPKSKIFPWQQTNSCGCQLGWRAHPNTNTLQCS